MQRPGKTHRAGASDNMHAMKLKNFFSECSSILKSDNNEAAFYFEQIEEWLRDGNSLPSERKEIARVLGI
jgi:hypothetical protein|tara:strand:+ start:9991 stop:10200 length:210 start_codon:yes stop_codon:yes gene_type:complete